MDRTGDRAALGQADLRSGRHCDPSLGVCCPVMRDQMSDVIGPVTLEDQANTPSRNAGQQTPSDGSEQR
jgi:hypothetical protein